MTATASRTTNRRPELLAPAGGPEPFAAALAAGADAIYCGMGSFNARRKATNFTDEAFEQACRAAHLAGSRVYVTVNIVIKQSEMSDALQLIHRCSTLGADAFIIQDWGLFFEVKRTMPGIETHISTQANIHDDRGTIWCREQGADRVTLSRELSIDEIAAIHDAAPDVDLEVFSHGAICFCYSGLCLLSSFAMAGRSAYGRVPSLINAEESVSLLVKAGADVNRANAKGRTPLIIAALAADPGMCRLLLSLGADKSAKDATGRTAADYAALTEEERLAEMYPLFPGAEKNEKLRKIITTAVQDNARGEECSTILNAH